MKSFNNSFNSIVFTLLLTVVLSIDASAQCKRFTKRNCLPSLDAYQHNGQLTTAMFSPGENADIEMTFNAGKTYRILACSQETIGNAELQVLDKTRKVLYTSKDGEQNPYWDFKVANTQQLIIHIKIPEMEKTNQKTDIMPNGCVSLLVGFK